MSHTLLREKQEVLEIPLHLIVASPYQPRQNFKETALLELAHSIREFGVMQPINVRLIGQKYELVAGERRLRASKIAGLETIPALLVEITDQDSALLALIENLQRENLNYIEEAVAYRNLINDYQFTQERLATYVGKSQSSIANKLRLLRLSPKIHTFLLNNKLTERHGRALLRLPDEIAQEALLEQVIKRDLTVKETEDLIERIIKPPLAKEAKTGGLKTVINDMRIYTNSIKETVETMKENGFIADMELENSDDGCMITILVAYNI